MSRLVLLLVGFLSCGNATMAQTVPPLMNYQGHLTNATGQPLPTGQYTLTFNVYNVPTGGTAVWGPQAIVADVVDGYFNVVLSTDSTGGDPITTAFVAQPRYVSISVNAAAEILPRQQVLSAPYAIQASRAAAADVASSTVGSANVFPGTGNVGIGTTTPDRALSVTGGAKIGGNLEVTGTVTTTGALSVGSNSTVSGLLTVDKIRAGSYKVCRVWTSGQWLSTTVVPDSWTRAHCNGYRAVEGAANYDMGCLFADGSASMGSGATFPNPNCGWSAP
jgi:hypothetical protein